MTNQTEPKEPTEQPTSPPPKPERKRPSRQLTREEEIDYFRKAAESDIALRELFARSAAVAAPAAALWG
ncbi:MAG: hypothetical protein IT327_07690 [Anaerolineae bacterium]|nr:hypothetical protein [Anaerolineae bacterium]